MAYDNKFLGWFAYSSTGSSVPPATTQLLDDACFDTVSYDTGGFLDSASALVAPSDGIYWINVVVQWNDYISDELSFITLYLNGTRKYDLFYSYLAGLQDWQIGGSILLDLTAGDKIEVYIRNDTTTFTRTIAGGTGPYLTYFQGMYLGKKY